MPDTVVLNVRESLQLDTLAELLRKITEEQGCPGCGFNGWDLRIRVDPRIRYEALARDFADEVASIDVVSAQNLGRQNIG